MVPSGCVSWLPHDVIVLRRRLVCCFCAFALPCAFVSLTSGTFVIWRSFAFRGIPAYGSSFSRRLWACMVSWHQAYRMRGDVRLVFMSGS